MPQVIIGKCLLQKLLNQKRMTPTDLSDITGISIHQLSAYINNKRNMSLPTAILIAWALKVTIMELYDWKIVK
jgi:plasmid maintenance system antidote protein VapI